MRQIPRAWERKRSTDEDFVLRPPLLCNSFPKSGTHLLLQILKALPAARSYGSFLASMPSVTFRERSRRGHLRRIGQMVPGEVVPAHLFYHSLHAGALEDCHCLHFFIYRDLRDVAVSEAYYLTYMNRWHRLHPFFRKLPTMEARIMAAIRGIAAPGFKYDYPDIGERFRRYHPWLGQADVITVRFEELVGDRRQDTVRRVVTAYAKRNGSAYNVEKLMNTVLPKMDPSKSHTFRKGGSGGWRDQFTDAHRQCMKEVAGDLLVQCGYEPDVEW